LPEEFGRVPEELGRFPDAFGRLPEALGYMLKPLGYMSADVGRPPAPLSGEAQHRGRSCGMLPMDAEILPQIPQQVLAERLMLRGLRELGPQIAHLVVSWRPGRVGGCPSPVWRGAPKGEVEYNAAASRRSVELAQCCKPKPSCMSFRVNG